MARNELLNSKAFSAVVTTVLAMVAGFGSRYVDQQTTTKLVDQRVTAIEKRNDAADKVHSETARILDGIGRQLERLETHQADTDRRVSTLEGRPSARSN